MTVGEKIKKIRTFRGMTQKELGLAVGFEEKGADNRLSLIHIYVYKRQHKNTHGLHKLLSVTIFA